MVYQMRDIQCLGRREDTTRSARRARAQPAVDHILFRPMTRQGRGLGLRGIIGQIVADIILKAVIGL